MTEPPRVAPPVTTLNKIELVQASTEPTAEAATPPVTSPTDEFLAATNPPIALPPVLRRGVDDARESASTTLEPDIVTTGDSPAVRSAVDGPTVVSPVVESPVVDSMAADSGAADSGAVATHPKMRWYQWPFWLLGRTWDLTCLCVIIAIVAAVPVVQLASLGYLLYAAGNLANGKPWRTALPGLRLAGKLGTFAMLVAVSWIPVYVLTDLSYSAQLLQPGSQVARAWRVGVFLFAFAWVTHVGWAALRGGRWWHFIWPAPVKFVVNIWRPATWTRASDRLYDLVTRLQFPRLWWLGARASAGALLWTCVPVSMMIIGERAQNFQAAPLVGIIGAISMAVVMMYLPVLQVHMAARDRFVEIFNVRAARKSFLLAPWFYALSIVFLCALAIPLYLLRIEATPSQLVWAPSLVFVLFMFPAKLLIGTALGYASHRTQPRHWILRWPAWGIELVAIGFYVGALYLAQFIAWQGAYVMYFQHAVLVPAPLIST